MVRCLRDKVPKGEFVIRACVLDRLIHNKMQYKFIEHGEKLKNLTAKEVEERRKLEEVEEQKGRASRKIVNTESSGDSRRKPLGYEESSSNSA